MVFASTFYGCYITSYLALYTKVFADIINTRLTPVNFLSSNSVREIDPGQCWIEHHVDRTWSFDACSSNFGINARK